MWLVPPSPPIHRLPPLHSLTISARLVIVAGPAWIAPSLPDSPTSFLFPLTVSIPSTSPPFWPGLSLWQVPPRAFPSSLLSLSTLPPYLSHLSILATSSPLARLVIVAGPAPFSPFPALLSLFIPSDPPSDTPLLLHSGPACHCGRSRHFLLPLITGPLYSITTLQARLAIVAGPASPIHLSFSSSSFLLPLYTLTSSPPLSSLAPWPGLPDTPLLTLPNVYFRPSL